MNKVSREIQEEIIWWMRNKIAAEPLESDSPDSSSRLFSLADEWPDISGTSKYNFAYEENVRIITSLLPDEVIYNYKNFNSQTYNCSIMVGVIAGYIDLYDYHCKMEHSNAQQFIANMNTYLSVVFEQILKFRGDILLCTGKVFWVMWKTTENMTKQRCIRAALDCALSVTKVCPRHEVTDDITLAVKFAIASGEVFFSLLGTQEASHFIIFGPPITDAHKAKFQAKPTQIILDKKCTAFLEPTSYIFEHLNDDEYLRVLGWGQSWKPENIYMSESHNDIVSASLLNSYGNVHSSKMQQQQQEFELRYTMKHVSSQNIMHSLQKFILPTIVHALTVSESLYHLTETRLVVAIYMGIIIEKGTLSEMFLTICECYQKIFREICIKGGHICEITCIEDELIILAAFGLRGFKQSLESKRALLCSMACYKELKTLNKVNRISIGISTGLTFCGILGHNLRRSFSLIGSVVYTATELMMSYPNRITCDRETFLQSRFEARNFVFQESNHIDITYHGAVYEYIEYTGLNYYPRSCLNTFPILGRFYELNLYKKILDKHLSESNTLCYNTLVVFGESRSGKSRLCEEFLFITPSDIPIFRIKLLPADKIAFKCIYKIFAYALDFSQTNSAERKVKLQAVVKYLRIPELVCMLNDIFDVNFPHSPLVDSFNEEEANLAISEIIEQISYFCFSKLWIIILDDGNNIDDESWPLLNAIRETNRVIMVISMAEEDKWTKNAKNLFKHPLCKKIRLRPISKWYYVGLACQVLQVSGIAKELDQVLQQKSHGNPGWIENFLISLVQGNYINVSTIPKSKLANFNLILAPGEMLNRSDENENTTETRITSNRGTIISLGERWNTIFRGVFEEARPSSPSSTYSSVLFSRKRTRTSDVKRKVEMIDICLVEPNMNINDVHPEIITDSKVIQILDSLSVHEQLFLKVSSVIGDIVPREMALNILTNITEKQTCLAVEKFFQLGIFGCAKGYFNHAYKNAILKPPSIRKTDELICECEGLDIIVDFEDLPSYVYCGYMHFKMPLIREVIYASLTSAQKYEYHTKSVTYLEEKTRKCKHCGGGQFYTILGKRYGLNFQKIMNKDFSKHIKIVKSWDVLNIFPGTIYNPWLAKTSATSRKSRKHKPRGKGGLRDSSARGGHKLSRGKMIRKFQYRESLTRSFSSYDFSECYCDVILRSFYEQMISHYFALNEMEKWMTTVFEYSDLCIELNNVPLSNQLLEQALVVLKTEIFAKYAKRGEAWRQSVIRGKIYTLMGSGMLKLGHHKLAHEYLMNALNNYGIQFPKNGTLNHRMTQIAQSIKLTFGSRLGNSTKQQYLAEYYDNVSDCLSVTYEVFAAMGLWENAEMAAIWSLRKALMSGRDFRTLIIGFSNTIRSLIVNKKLKSILWFEIRSLLYCKLYNITVTSKDLKVISTLYIHIFVARVLRSELVKAIELGKIILNLLPAVNINYDYMNIFPLLIYILIAKKKFRELIYQIFNINTNLGEDTLRYGATWYYGICLVVQLETGTYVENYKTCEKHHFSNMIVHSNFEEKSTELRFYVCLWLWCLRTGMYEDAEMWESKVRKRMTILKNATPLNLTTCLYFLESLLLKYVYKLNCLATDEVMVLNSEIVKMISTLSNEGKGTFIKPRLEHLKAYYVLSRDGEIPAISILKSARKLAKLADLSFEADYIKHTEMAWSRELSDTVLTRWKSDINSNAVEFHELAKEHLTIGYYTFEPPLYS